VPSATALRLSVDLPYPPQTVWRALTERSLLAEWFLPTDLAPVAGGVFRIFPPPGLAGFSTPIDVDVLEVVEPELIRQRWRGEELHTETLFHLVPSRPGCKISVSQTGFFGLSGQVRRAAILSAFEVLFQQRLPVLLASLPTPSYVGTATVAPARVPWWRKLFFMPVHRRLRLLSAGGAMILTVLAATALATLVLSPPRPPAEIIVADPDPVPVPGSGTQPVVSAPPAPSRSSSPSVSSAAAVAFSARFAVLESWTGGYIGSVTLTPASPLTGWTARLKFPTGAKVTSAWDRMSYTITGDQVVFSPQPVHSSLDAGASFTFFFQAGSDARPVSCSVNGVGCSGL
jgi:uncharacterized protein YndB with AHSA1/START domain